MKTLYISDLDGTLLGKDARPSDFTVETINSLIKKGVNITFATARSASSASRILPRFDLKLPVILMNGVCLTDIKSGQQIHTFSMDATATEKVVKIFEKHNRPPLLFTFNDQNELCVDYKTVKSEYERNFIERRKTRYKHLNQCSEYNISGGSVYVAGIDEKQTVDAICEELKWVEGVSFSCYLDTYSDNKYFVEVYSDKAGKHKTLEILKQMYGFEKIVAFGDNSNDVDMLKFADVAVAVGNAQAKAKEVADIIIDTNENDAVAKFILQQTMDD